MLVEFDANGVSYTLSLNEKQRVAWVFEKDSLWWCEQSKIFKNMEGMWLPPLGANTEWRWWGWIEAKNCWARLDVYDKGWITRAAGDQWFGNDKYVDAAGAEWLRDLADGSVWRTLKPDGKEEWWDERLPPAAAPTLQTAAAPTSGFSASSSSRAPEVTGCRGVAGSLGTQSDSDLSYTNNDGTVWKRHKTTDQWWWALNPSKRGKYMWWREQPKMSAEDGDIDMAVADGRGMAWMKAVPVDNDEDNEDLRLQQNPKPNCNKRCSIA